jgi:WD40 repeat protein
LHVGTAGTLAPIVQYNPADTELAVATGSGGGFVVGNEVRIIDPVTGRTLLHTPAAKGNAAGDPSDLVFSHDGSILYYASGLSVVRWDLRTDQVRNLAGAGLNGVGAPYGLWAVALSPDARRLAVGGQPGVAILDTSTGRVLATRTSGWVWWVAFTPRDGRELGVATAPLAPAEYSAGSLLLLSSRTLRSVRTLVRLDGDAVTAFAFARDGGRVAFGTNEGQAGVNDLRSGNQFVSFPGHTTNIWQIAFSPDGHEAATSAGDGSAVIWRATGAETRSIATDGLDPGVNGYNAADLAFQPRRVVARYSPINGPYTGDEVIQAWALNGRSLGARMIGRGAESYSRISADGLYALSGELNQFGYLSRIAIRDIATRRTVATVALPNATNLPFGTSYVQFSPGGSWIAYPTATPEGSWRFAIHQVMTGRVLTFPGISSLCPFDWFSFGDGDRLVAASDVCGHVVVVNAQTGRLVVRRDFVGFLDLGPAVLKQGRYGDGRGELGKPRPSRARQARHRQDRRCADRRHQSH